MKMIIADERMAQLLERHRRAISTSPELSITGAADGQAILDLHRAQPATLLILDTELDGLTPEQICRSVRSHPTLRRVSIIVIGTDSSLESVKRCVANRSFIRPLHQDDFLGAVHTLVNVSERKNFRVLMSLELTGEVGGTPFFGKSENISPTGILFSSNRSIEKDSLVHLMFVLPGQGKVDTKAEIVRVETLPGRECKYGAKFIDPSRQAFRMLENFISTRLR